MVTDHIGETRFSKIGRKVMKRTLSKWVDNIDVDRRRFLSAVLGA
jgi:hypothetical protein